LYPEKDLASGVAEAQAVVAALALAKGARILDLGCGNGRHVLALARAGYDAVGVDASSELLRHAAAARDAGKVECELLLADMRQLPLERLEPCQAVISLFTSFGLFTDAENEQVARGMAACLLPGGRLLLDLNNRVTLEAAHGKRMWVEREGGYLLDEFAYDADAHRFWGNRILITEGRVRRYPFDHRVYSEPEIRALLRRVGLRVLAIHGSLDRTPFNARSPRMVVVAEKP
jgi:SAM-dependent methyltransferase